MEEYIIDLINEDSGLKKQLIEKVREAIATVDLTDMVRDAILEIFEDADFNFDETINEEITKGLGARLRNLFKE